MYRAKAGGKKLKKIAKMKRCPRCKKFKDESEFGKKPSRKDGLRSWCRKCESEYSRKYYRRGRGSVRKQRRYDEFHRVVDGVKQKRCNKCRRWKPEDKFHKGRKSKDGLQWYCKKCLNEATRKYYKKEGEPLKKYYVYEQCHRVVGGVKEKRCRRCGKWKTESKFYKQSKHKDGLANRCKECANKATNKARKQRLAVRN